MRFDEVGHEVFVLQQKTEFGGHFGQFDRFGDDVVSARQALLARTAPIEIEVRKRSEEDFPLLRAGRICQERTEHEADCARHGTFTLMVVISNGATFRTLVAAPGISSSSRLAVRTLRSSPRKRTEVRTVSPCISKTRSTMAS